DFAKHSGQQPRFLSSLSPALRLVYHNTIVLKIFNMDTKIDLIQQSSTSEGEGGLCLSVFHESPPYSNNYPSRNEDSLESIIRHLIQEETQKCTGYRQNRQNQYNNRGRNNNYNNNYNSSNNYSCNQNEKPSYSYQPCYNRQENKNTDTYHNIVRNQNQNRNYTPQRINNIGDNNNPRARPNSPSGTLAALLEEAECEQNTLEENDYEHINHEDADEAKLEERKDWDNIFEIESYHSSEFDDDNDNECIDDFTNFDDELFAARQSTRELRPRNVGAHEVPMENLPHQPPSPLQNSPTIDLPEKEKEKEKEKETGLQSVFGKTAFSKEKTPPFVKPTQPPPLKGKQWSNFRTDFEKMDLDSTPVISSPEEESTRSTFKQNKKTLQPKNTTIKKNQPKTQPKPKTKASKMPSKRKTTAVSRAPPLLKRMPYNISTDILNCTGDISFGQLLALVPSLQRQFTGACKHAYDLSVLDDATNSKTRNTTALYAHFYIKSKIIRCLIDSGSSRCCISKKLADQLGLKIDKSSTAVFVLGNNERQSSLGTIQHVALYPDGTEPVHIDLEVLPVSATELIIGNNEDTSTSDEEYSSTDEEIDQNKNNNSYKNQEPMLEEMLTNEYWLEEELFQLADNNPPLYIEASENDNYHIYISQKFEMGPGSYETYEIPIDYHIHTTYYFKLRDNNVDPDNILDFYGGILYPNEQTYRLTVMNLVQADTILNKGVFLGSLQPIDDQTQGYEITEINEMIIPSITKNQPPLTEEKLKQIEIGDTTPKIRKELISLIQQYQDVFSWDENTIGCTDRIEHKLVIDKNVAPIRSRPYRMAPSEVDYLKSELSRLYKLNIIRPSSSPWSSPIMLAKKKDNSLRFLVDLRKINAIIKKDAYSLPHIDDLLDSLGSASVFSALYMRSGYFQVPLKLGLSQDLVSFSTCLGSYTFTRLPQGLSTSVFAFQRLIDCTFQNLINRCVLVYLDDINCFSPTPQQHIHDLAKSKPFILLTDASRSGLGAVLSQLDNENRERVILYASRGLKPNEKNYGISKLECLAVVWAVELLRPYLLSKEFTIYTDHSALKGLLQNPNPSSILARWIVKLTDYSYTIKYRPGKALKNVDFLSCLGY
ncbi:hypothetical protein INT45_002702, partial [Circinella minor]